jgi:hypothetical protein
MRCGLVLIVVFLVGGQGYAALPAGDDGGWCVVTVWTGEGIEEGREGAEGEVGVDAAGESRVVSIFPVRRWKGTDGRLQKRTN